MIFETSMQTFKDYTSGLDQSMQENNSNINISVLDMSSFKEGVVASKNKSGKSVINQRNASNTAVNDSLMSNKSFKQYGLHNWRQYAAEKHGNSKHFQESIEGRKCIESTAVQKYAKEMLALKQWADEVEKLAQQLIIQMNSDSELQIINNRKV